MDASARAMQIAKGDPDVLTVAWTNHVRAEDDACLQGLQNLEERAWHSERHK